MRETTGIWYQEIVSKRRGASPCPWAFLCVLLHALPYRTPGLTMAGRVHGPLPLLLAQTQEAGTRAREVIALFVSSFQGTDLQMVKCIRAHDVRILGS